MARRARQARHIKRLRPEGNLTYRCSTTRAKPHFVRASPALSSTGASNNASTGPVGAGPPTSVAPTSAALPSKANALYSSQNVDSLVFYIADRYGFWAQEGLPHSVEGWAPQPQAANPAASLEAYSLRETRPIIACQLREAQLLDQ